MNSLRDQSLLVLGLGDSGLAMCAWALRNGAAQVKVWDSRENPPQLATLREHHPDVAFFSGELMAAHLLGVDRVLKSPGLSPRDARLSAAYAVGVPVQGELDLFAQALAGLKTERRYNPFVLAITGTNGKTTTTSMTAQLCEASGLRVGLAGNIGPSMLTTLADALDLEPQDPQLPLTSDSGAMPLEMLPGEAETVAEVEVEADAEVEALEGAVEPTAEPAAESAIEAPPESAVSSIDEDRPLPIKPPPPKGPVFEHLPEVWVLELSSFQLDDVHGFEPTAGAVLNITQDHLDWHGDMAAYAAAKARIFGTHALMVVNRDDPAVEALVPAPVMVKQGRGKASKLQGRRVARFGLNAPRHPGDFGLLEEGGIAWLVRAREADETFKRKPGEEEEILIQRLMPADALRVRGRHNAANALAALALATAAGAPLAPMLHALREYRGEPHRVEHVQTIDGIDFYDDSKGTNVGATVAAILGLGADRAPSKLVMILGGDGKGQDFSPLREPVMRFVRAVALIGRDGPAIASVIEGSGVPMQSFDTLQAATRWAYEQAEGTDSVLLSPACASLDMFRNYGHRAEVFVSEVQAIANDGGHA
jgi:UDP-N-acetylmuramoylalanine--D-glutamate ligase